MDFLIYSNHCSDSNTVERKSRVCLGATLSALVPSVSVVLTRGMSRVLKKPFSPARVNLKSLQTSEPFSSQPRIYTSFSHFRVRCEHLSHKFPYLLRFPDSGSQRQNDRAYSTPYVSVFQNLTGISKEIHIIRLTSNRTVSSGCSFKGLHGSTPISYT